MAVRAHIGHRPAALHGRHGRRREDLGHRGRRRRPARVHRDDGVPIMRVVASRAGVSMASQWAALWPMLFASAVSWVATRATADGLSNVPPIICLFATSAACVLVYLAVLCLSDRDVLRTATRHARRIVPRRAPAVAHVVRRSGGARGPITAFLVVFGESSVGERDLDASAAEVDHRDQGVGKVESKCTVRQDLTLLSKASSLPSDRLVDYASWRDSHQLVDDHASGDSRPTPTRPA